MEEIKKTIEDQLKEKKNRELEIKNLNKEFDIKLKNSYSNFIKCQEEKESIKKNKVIIYKQELDKQLEEKHARQIKPLMNENERLMNRLS